MKKSFVLLASILFGVSAYASIPIIDASSVIESQSLSSGLLEIITASMEDETIIAAILCFSLGIFGAHWFYLGNKAKGYSRLGLLLGGYAVIFAGYAVIFAGALASVSTGILGIALACYVLGYLAILADFALMIIDLVNILTNKV